MRAVVLVALLFSALPAAAHIRMDFPIGRYSDTFQKEAPCGAGANDPRSGNINTFEPGATVRVRWTETIDHFGSFRVAFDVDGADLADFDNPDNALGSLVDPPNEDNLERTLDVVLPDVECDNCTLQLIQDMTGDLYYQCADLVIAEGAGNDVDSGGTDGPLPGACSAGAGLALPIALLAILRRRRP